MTGTKFSHELELQAADDGVHLVCTDEDHDWSRKVTSPDLVEAARSAHDREVRGALRPGVYLVDRNPEEPRIYLLMPDRRWKIGDYWKQALEPSLETLSLVGNVDTGVIR